MKENFILLILGLGYIFLFFLACNLLYLIAKGN